MTYSIIDIIKNGKPGEIYRAAPIFRTENRIPIQIAEDGCLIDIEDSTYLSHSFLVNAIRDETTFKKVESAEEQVKNIIYKYVDEDNGDIEKLYSELKPYLKEEA